MQGSPRSIYLPDDLVAVLRQRAAANERTVSAETRVLLRAALADEERSR